MRIRPYIICKKKTVRDETGQPKRQIVHVSVITRLHNRKNNYYAYIIELEKSKDFHCYLRLEHSLNLNFNGKIEATLTTKLLYSFLNFIPTVNKCYCNVKKEILYNILTSWFPN